MAISTIRTTYALTPDTVARLEKLAQHWQVSKSAALRRAIDEASTRLVVSPQRGPLKALRALRAAGLMKRSAAEKWAKESARERKRDRTGS
jgi:predicted transcriptional regulator